MDQQDRSRSENFRHVHGKIDSIGREVSGFGMKLDMHLDHADQRFAELHNKVAGVKEEKREEQREKGQWARALLALLGGGVAALFIKYLLEGKL